MTRCTASPAKKYAAIAISLRHQQMMAPWNDVADFEVAGEADQVADDGDEIGVRAAARNAG